jgi:hypothetical protein
MKKDDATLGIDPKFTRPGVLCLLKKLKKLIDQLADSNGCEYLFKLPVGA